MFKFKMTPDRHNAIQNLNYYLCPDPPLFSLPSTFKKESWNHGQLQKCKKMRNTIRCGYVDCRTTYPAGSSLPSMMELGCLRKCFFHFRRNTEFSEKHTEFRGIFIEDFSQNSAEYLHTEFPR
jgi:hypothetical protein